MHLGLIGGKRPDGFQENIADSLRHMGHVVTYLGSTATTSGGRQFRRLAESVRLALPAVEARWHRRLAYAAWERQCDGVITVESDLSPDAVAVMRRHRIPVALWFPDPVSNFGRERMLIAPYSALYFKDPLVVSRLRDLLGIPVWYLPEACNPRRHRPLGEPGSRAAIAVVGTYFPSRLALLRRLHDAGVPMAVYGPPVPRWARGVLPAGLHAGRALFREEKSQVFRTAAAVLNGLRPGEMHSVNKRLFEATGAGAAVVCEQRPALTALFEAGDEVATFGNFHQLLERLKGLLDDPGLTRKIGDAASRRSHAEHTYEHRLPVILERMA